MNEAKKQSAFGGFLRNLTKNSVALITGVLILMVIIAAIFSPYFLTLYNLQSLMRDVAFIGMIAVAQSLLLLIGELDLSVGAIATLSGVFAGLLMTTAGANSFLSLLVGVLSGGVLGGLNGLLVTRLRLNSMVTTIGMQAVYSGVTLVITRGKAITGIPDEIFFLGKGSLAGIPVPFLFMLLVVVLIVFMVKKTKTGRYVYAIGNSKEASRIMGIRVDSIRLLLYAIVGLVSALAGILCVARLGTAQASIGAEWPMNSIAACVIGGVLLTGGVGSPVGAVIGAVIISVISNVIVLFGVNVYWQQAVNGIVIVVAIALPAFMAIIRERKRYKKVRG